MSLWPHVNDPWGDDCPPWDLHFDSDDVERMESEEEENDAEWTR